MADRQKGTLILFKELLMKEDADGDLDEDTEHED